MAYLKLQTEKYWNACVQSEIKQIRREKNRQAVGTFMQFCFVAIVMAGALYALNTMPAWLPAVADFMEQSGITEKLHAFKAWLS